MNEAGQGLSGASDRIRETAKWFAVSVAVVGGVVAAGLQLTDIGKLDVNSGRLVPAIVGAALAVLGALVILWVVVGTMTGEATSLHSIARKAPHGAEQAVADPTLLAAYSTVADIEAEYLDAVRERRKAYEDARAHPADQDKITVANLADNRFIAIDQVVTPLLDVVSYQRLAHAWKTARLLIVGGAVLATLGLGVFAWAANPPPDAAESMAAANILTAPTRGRIQLTEAGMSALQQSAGTACWDTSQEVTPTPSSPPGATPMPRIHVLVLGRTDAGPDVLLDQSGCNRVRLLLTPAWGTLTV